MIGKKLAFLAKLAALYIAAHRRYFLIGLGISFLAAATFSSWRPYILRSRLRAVGIAGNYTISTLPRFLQEEVSFGLIRLDSHDQATTGAALSWEATDAGKTYLFRLNPDLVWQDGKKLTAADINYNLKNVTVERPDAASVRFNLAEPFAPILSLLTQPLFRQGLVGLGDKKVISLDLAGRFLNRLELEDKNGERIVLKFYPSEPAAVTALRLGAIREARFLHSRYGLEDNPDFQIQETVADRTVALLFFRTNQPPFDNKIFRQALTYALPDKFSQAGEIADAPLSRNSWVRTSLVKKYPHSPTATQSGQNKIILAANRALFPTAEEIAQAWREAGLETEILAADLPPANFGAYLTYWEVPFDPDQYSLWHSTQTGNISAYKSPKADKLLEEGRRTLDPTLRKEIYGQFFKALTEDAPAAFLFYPKLYTISRQ